MPLVSRLAEQFGERPSPSQADQQLADNTAVHVAPAQLSPGSIRFQCLVSAQCPCLHRQDLLHGVADQISSFLQHNKQPNGHAVPLVPPLTQQLDECWCVIQQTSGADCWLQCMLPSGFVYNVVYAWQTPGRHSCCMQNPLQAT